MHWPRCLQREGPGPENREKIDPTMRLIHVCFLLLIREHSYAWWECHPTKTPARGPQPHLRRPHVSTSIVGETRRVDSVPSTSPHQFLSLVGFFIKPPPEPHEPWTSCFSFWESKASWATVPARSGPRPAHHLGSTRQ